MSLNVPPVGLPPGTVAFLRTQLLAAPPFVF